MKRNFWAATAAFLMLAAGGAQAHAYADFTIGGVDVSQNSSGFNYALIWFGEPLAPGASLSRTFDYSIKLHTDGLPATRTWGGYCSPESTCGPADDGQEHAQFDFFILQARDANPLVHFDISDYPAFASNAVGPGQTLSYSGSFTITETVDFNAGDANAPVLIYAGTWVDSNDMSSPVPEPANGLLLLAGALAVIGASGGPSRSRHLG